MIEKSSFDVTSPQKYDMNPISIPQSDIPLKKYELSNEYEPKPVNYDSHVPSYQSSYKYSVSSDKYSSNKPTKPNDLD